MIDCKKTKFLSHISVCAIIKQWIDFMAVVGGGGRYFLILVKNKNYIF